MVNSAILFLGLMTAAPRIAVLDVKARVGVTNELAQAVTDDVVAEVRRLLPNARVVSADEIRSTLKYDLTKRDMGCDVTACLAEIGGALGVEQLVTGTLSKFGSTYLLSLKLVDPRSASVKRQFTKQIGGQSDEALLQAVAQGVGELFPEVPSPLQAPAPPPPVPPTITHQPAPTAAVAPPETLPAKSADANTWMPVVGWTGLGLSIASLAAGGILLGVAANQRSAANADPTAAGTYDKTQTANAESTAAIGCLVAGGVLLIPSLVFLLIPHHPASPSN